MRPGHEVAETERVAGLIEVVDWRWGVNPQSEQQSVLDRLLVEKQIVAMEVDRQIERAFCRSDAGDVVDVRVRQQNMRQHDVLTDSKLEQRVHFIAGIDQHAFARARTRHHETVLEERPHRLRLDYDHEVILAILDDLLFTSKIRSTAKQIGATLSVARSPDAALAEMRANTPSLVIFDLNNPRTDPLGIVASMKGDPALAGIHTVGFVSHVQTDLIDAARKAGVDQVMARSMFAERLPQILVGGM